MRNTQIQAAEAPSTLRFGVIEGNRHGKATPRVKSISSVLGLSSLNRASVNRPSVNHRHRGLHLVTGAQKPANREPVARSFEQARQIVAQVEWEIAQQAGRERRKVTRHWQPLTFALSTARTQTASGMTRLRRFLGL